MEAMSVSQMCPLGNSGMVVWKVTNLFMIVFEARSFWKKYIPSTLSQINKL